MAPLSVFFDASQTTANGVSDTFEALDYKWNFDDTSSGTWQYSGQSKNVAIGPEADHVFEQPGDYTVTLTVTRSDGATASRNVSIHVTDPDVVFAGNTVCITQSSTSTPDPECDSTVVAPNNSLSNVSNQLAAGKHILLERGSTWSGSMNLNKAGPGIIGAYGSGAKPLINMDSANSTIFTFSSGSNPIADDWRIMDIATQSSTDHTVTASFEGYASNILFLRMDTKNIGGLISSTSTYDYYNSKYGNTAQDLPNGVAVVDCHFDTASAGANFHFLAFRRFTFMGNYAYDSTPDEHVLRSPFMDTGVIEHNYLGKSHSAKHLLKLHAPNFNNAGIGQGKYSEKVVISDNTFLAGDGDWSVVFGPQNSINDERVRRIIFERNHMIGHSPTQVFVVVWADDVAIRNNIMDATGNMGGTGIILAKNTLEPDHKNIWVVGNTFYASNKNLSLVSVDTAHVTNYYIVGNLIVSTSGSASVGSSAWNSSNIAMATNPLVSASPSNPMDYALGSDIPIDAGSYYPYLLRDYTGAFRNNVGSSTIISAGALEF